MPPSLNTEILNPIKGRDIVVISLSHWDTKIGSNARNIATRFARHNRVLYVNYPITRKTYLLNQPDAETQVHISIIKEKSDSIRKLDANLWVCYPTSLIESVKWLPFTFLFKAANYINNRRYAKNIKKSLKALGFKDIIIFNDMDIYNGFYLKELLKPSMYIYYFKDFLQGFKYWKKHATVMEPELIKKVDAVVANSTFYDEYCQTLTEKSYYIGQGCDLRLFVKNKERKVPEDMKHISGPIIGYVGVLDAERLDEKIIKVIARENSAWNIVLVGPSDEFFKQSSLHQYTNIHFLGWKHINELPDYIEAFDICMNPQSINNITRGNYPLKIDEYLAMGKPVVATRTKAMKLFENYTYLADKPEEYPSLIRKALLENNKEKENQRIDFANSHTWENCVSEIYKVMSAHFKTPV
jgi:teichuronic acid biosynthesis glycosyltransferase TuaH